MTAGERIVAVCKAALANGSIGDQKQGAFYRAFISCGYAQPLTNGGADIGRIRTSCAIFVRAVLHWAGRAASRQGRIGQAVNGGWLEGMTFSHKAWVWNEKGAKPTPGCIFARDYSRKTTGLYHVGIFVERLPDGTWITAEGGGGDGTECRLSEKGKALDGKDGLNRIILGWWRPEALAMSDSPRTMPTPEQFARAPERSEADELPTLRSGSRDPAVEKLQEMLKLVVTGVFDRATRTAVRNFQRSKGLDVDGVVGPLTWRALWAANPPKMPEGLPDPLPNLPARKEVLYAFPGLERTTPQFRDALVSLGAKIDIDPNALAAVMSIESGFNPAIRNPHKDAKGESAVGLIQFMPFLLRHWGLTVAQVAAMSAVDQLALVGRFYQNANYDDDPGTLYMLTFMPAAAYYPDNYILGEKDSEEIKWGLSLHKIYLQNAGLDRDKDGDIEVGEVKSLARDRYASAKAKGLFRG